MSEETQMGTKIPQIDPVTSEITLADRWIHIMARWGINRLGHRIKPGLYTIGLPKANSEVFVTANYSLSFDALRKALKGIDGYILVLDTKGINVWCAAGKGTFGTDELVNRIEATALHEVVSHRRLILPQLGAPGVAAHEVKKRCGFNVKYGPVKAVDLPEYLKTKEATLEMRKVKFPLKDRIILIPVEVVGFLIPMLVATILFYFLSGPILALSILSSILAATILFPILLPWLPTHNFSTKGLVLGSIISLPFFLMSITGNTDEQLLPRLAMALPYMLILPPITAFISLNFTGATTFTSRSGVKLEIFTYIPVMAWMFGGGIVLSLIFNVFNLFGGSL
ncbi:MAG: mercury methylation corrinoid protein HgcA [Candidatus Neomarinimicrobiota bacterium]